MAHTRKRVRKLSTAVFRDAKSEFIFDVYPISPDITDGAAVFIFSRHTADKHGRWHHTVSCIGETTSIAIEMKKHRRSKCIKTNSANVVCIRKEVDEITRTSAVDDLASARAFSCVRGIFRTNIRPTTDAKRQATANIFPFKAVGKRRAARAVARPAKSVSVADDDTNSRKQAEPKRKTAGGGGKRLPKKKRASTGPARTRIARNSGLKNRAA